MPEDITATGADTGNATPPPSPDVDTDTSEDTEDTPKREPRQYERTRYKNYRNVPEDDEEDEDLEDETDDEDDDSDEDDDENEGKEKSKDGKDSGKEKKEDPKKAKSEGDEKGYRVKVTVDGKTGTVDLEQYLPGLGKLYEAADPATKEKFLRNVQKSIAADKRFEENTKLKRHASAIVQTLKSDDPLSIFRHPAMKMDPQKYREALEKELWENFIHPEQMDPKERENWELKRELQLRRDKEEQAKKESESKELAEAHKFYQDDFQKGIMAAIDEHSLPKSAYVVGLFAKYMRQAMQHKKADGTPFRIKPAQVADIVKEDLQKMYKHMFASADGDRLIEVFGEEIAEKINAAKLKKLEAGGDKPRITGERPPKREKRKGKKGPTSFAEWRTRNRPVNR